MRKVIIVGMGEIGSAIHQMEKEAGNQVDIVEIDHNTSTLSEYDLMHVCIPYRGNEFVDIVSAYIKQYNPQITVIHSTVAVGTTDKIVSKVGMPVVYSFVRGIHPMLYEGIKTFVKYIGGNNSAWTELVQLHFDSLGIQGSNIGSARAGELAKLLDTTYYGWNILFAKEVKRLCDLHQVDFDKVYTHPNRTYNEGYARFGKHNVIRPVLLPPENRIGGHCVSENFELLPESRLKRMCKELNESNVD